MCVQFAVLSKSFFFKSTCKIPICIICLFGPQRALYLATKIHLLLWLGAYPMPTITTPGTVYMVVLLPSLLALVGLKEQTNGMKGIEGKMVKGETYPTLRMKRTGMGIQYSIYLLELSHYLLLVLLTVNKLLTVCSCLLNSALFVTLVHVYLYVLQRQYAIWTATCENVSSCPVLQAPE